MFSVNKYINSIKSNLDKQSDLLVGNLKKAVALHEEFVGYLLDTEDE